MAVASKPFWESTTLWINFAGIVAVLLNVLVASGKIVDPEWVALLVAVLNIVNRFRGIEPKKLTLT